MRFSDKRLQTFLDQVSSGRVNTFFSELCAVQILKEKLKELSISHCDHPKLFNFSASFKMTALGIVRACWLGACVCTAGFLFGHNSGM